MTVFLSMVRRSCARIVVVALFFTPLTAAADGIVVGKVYNPYVQPLETEVELRSVSQTDDNIADVQRHSLGFGRSLSDRVAIEVYAVGLEGFGESLSLDSYELEAKWQLTEQGEYAADWGLLFELEREVQRNVWEFAASVLAARDIGRLTTTANLGLIYEWGHGVKSEFESRLRLQARYRLKETFEPAFEFHMGQDTVALGPAVTGLIRASQGKKLRWEIGAFAGIDEKSPDRSFKANLEFEF